MIFDTEPQVFDSSGGTSSSTERATSRVALYLFFAVLAAAALVAAALGIRKLSHWAFRDNPEFRVRFVSVKNSGGGYVPESEVLQTLGLTKMDLDRGVSMFSFRIPERHRAFLAAHPNVHSLTIERHLPDTLVICLGDRTPVARIGRRRLLADDTGKVFALSSEMEYVADALPVLRSERFTDAKDGAVLPKEDLVAINVLRAMRNSPLKFSFEIGEIDLTGEYYLDLTTKDNKYIQLPRECLDTDDGIISTLWFANQAVQTPYGADNATFTVTRTRSGAYTVSIAN